MIIALTKKHEAAEQLAMLSALLRAQSRSEESAAPDGMSDAVNITETSHGNNTATYMILPGNASSQTAIASYQYLRKYFPSVLDILCHSTSRSSNQITIEIGTLPRQDTLSYSQHDLLRIMPRILALFRGTA